MNGDNLHIYSCELTSAPMDSINMVEERIIAYASSDGFTQQRRFADFAWLQKNCEKVYDIFRVPKNYENGIQWRDKLQELVRVIFSDSIGKHLPKSFFDPHSATTLPQKEKEWFQFLSVICASISDPDLQGFVICGIRDAIKYERGLDKALLAKKYYPTFLRYFEENWCEVKQSNTINTPMLYQKLDNVFESLGLLLLRARMSGEKYLNILRKFLIDEWRGKTPACFLLRSVVNEFRYLPDDFFSKYMSEEQLLRFKQVVYSKSQMYAVDTLDWIMQIDAPAKIGFPYATAATIDSAYIIATQTKYTLDYRLLSLKKFADGFIVEDHVRELAPPYGGLMHEKYWWSELTRECNELLADVTSGKRKLLELDDLFASFEAEVFYVAAVIASYQGVGAYPRIFRAIQRLKYVIWRNDGIALVFLCDDGERKVSEFLLPSEKQQQYIESLKAAARWPG